MVKKGEGKGEAMTQIKVKKKTAEALKGRGVKGETYDDVIQKMLEMCVGRYR